MKFNLKKLATLLLCSTVAVSGLYMPVTAKAADANPKVTLTTNISSGVSQNYIIEGSSVSLDDLQLKYSYTKSDSKNQMFNCDNAGLNLNVAPYYKDVTKNVSGKFTNSGLEISFNNAGNLSNGRLNLGVRINNSDWSSYSNFKEVKFEVVYKGSVIKTEIYDASAPTAQPTAVPTARPTAQPTAVPTAQPTAVPTAQPTAVPTAQPTAVPTAQPTGTCILPACSVDQNGPFQVTVQTGVGPSGKGWLVRPTNLGTNGMTKHPVFIWGPGGGDSPRLYEGFMKQWASMGFIVYSEESQWSGDQAPKALDWICAQANNRSSVLYGKVDTTRMAAGGFSLGSVGAYRVAADPRIITTIHCDGGSFDGKGHLEWKHPTCVMNGLNDGGLAMNNTDRDYNAANVPIWYGGIIGGGHGSTVWDGNAAITGWLRWQVGGDTSCRDMFLTPQGRFNNGKFKSRWKNWN